MALKMDFLGLSFLNLDTYLKKNWIVISKKTPDYLLLFYCKSKKTWTFLYRESVTKMDKASKVYIFKQFKPLRSKETAEIIGSTKKSNI